MESVKGQEKTRGKAERTASGTSRRSVGGMQDGQSFWVCCTSFSPAVGRSCTHAEEHADVV